MIIARWLNRGEMTISTKTSGVLNTSVCTMIGTVDRHNETL